MRTGRILSTAREQAGFLRQVMTAPHGPHGPSSLLQILDLGLATGENDIWRPRYRRPNPMHPDSSRTSCKHENISQTVAWGGRTYLRARDGLTIGCLEGVHFSTTSSNTLHAVTALQQSVYDAGADCQSTLHATVSILSHEGAQYRK